MLRRLGIVGTAAAIALTSACGSSSSAHDDVIKVGVINSDTGAYAFAGAVAHDAMKVAVDHINAKGGVHGRKLVLDFKDNSSEISQAVALAGKFASDSSYLAIIGPTSTPESLAVAPVANKRRMPLVGATVVGGAMLDSGPWVFKTAANSASIMREMAKVATGQLGLKRIAVVYGRENEAQVEQRDAFEESVKGAGGEIVEDIGVLNKDTNFSDVGRKVVASDPDALFVAMTGDSSANVVVQTKRAGLGKDVRILGTSQSLSKEYISVGAQSVNGTIAATDYTPTLDSAMNRQFVDDYKAAYGKLPDAYAAMGYQAIIMLVDALEDIDGSISRAALKDQLNEDRAFDGVLGQGHTTIKDRVPDGRTIPRSISARLRTPDSAMVRSSSPTTLRITSATPRRPSRASP
jgi:branched-chain amino acid transport system substrate-binding protein